MELAFTLPGPKVEMKAHAKVAWHDETGNVGVRFVKVAAKQERMLELWLAQQFLAN